jgi:hypothetical protein
MYWMSTDEPKYLTKPMLKELVRLTISLGRTKTESYSKENPVLYDSNTSIKLF